ncbi:hypothetical protein [Paenibacillus sp.]|jgi:predicted DNA-binding transcriptional regulator YafY|uniref:hypothetical protein n=1 Tax=Paenibacillus sp. TaxID=58172 RepID=UPI002824C4A4|nr:hypothetical protein [Paenibacillus sp.]MDR0270222.1 hypothetical protein [Paenibacillus sp.]
MLGKYIGQRLEIVYLDRSGKITQRKIEVKGIRGQLIRAICLQTGAPRTFRLDRILAWQLAKIA